MTKRFLALMVALGCLVLNLSHSSAESWVRYSAPPPIGILYVDFDSIVVEKYNPPEYTLRVTMAINVGNGLAYNKTTFHYNYDTKSISKYKFALPYSVWEETTWDKRIAADIWNHYYNSDFYEENRIAEEKRRKEAEFNSLVAQGDKFYADKNYFAAAKSYAEAKKMDPTLLYELYKNLVKNGDSLDEQGQHLAALDYYKKAVTMDEYGGCAYKLESTYRKVKKFDDAVSFYKAMATGGYRSFWKDLAEIYYELKDYENAVKAYTSYLSYTIYISYNGGSYYTYNGRGNAYSALGQYELAIHDYDKAIELYPKYEGNAAYTGRAYAYEKLKEYKKALKDYKKALKLDRSNVQARQGIERISKMK